MEYWKVSKSATMKCYDILLEQTTIEKWQTWSSANIPAIRVVCHTCHNRLHFSLVSSHYCYRATIILHNTQLTGLINSLSWSQSHTNSISHFPSSKVEAVPLLNLGYDLIQFSWLQPRQLLTVPILGSLRDDCSFYMLWLFIF